jgi:hypothetical protein
MCPLEAKCAHPATNEPAKEADGDPECAAPDVRTGLGRSAGVKWDLRAGVFDTWTTAPLSLKANRNEIHIWRVEATESNAALLASAITEAEHARAKCFRLSASRNEFIAARGFIRFVLGRYLGVPPESIALAIANRHCRLRFWDWSSEPATPNRTTRI